MQLGSMVSLTGNVTTLNWVGARSAAEVERLLGFGARRLASGYWVMLLKQALHVDDFEFDGTTLRSGGRVGLPLASNAADAARIRIHDAMIAEYGPDGYLRLQQAALASAVTHGPQRIVKILPDTPHDASLAPNLQYPMGGGGLQWKLVRPCRFLAAMRVDGQGNASTLAFTTTLGPHVPYENRAKVQRWLQAA